MTDADRQSLEAEAAAISARIEADPDAARQVGQRLENIVDRLRAERDAKPPKPKK